MTPIVSPTLKYIVRSVIGFIILAFGMYAMVAGIDVTDDLTKLLVIVYGIQQASDGFLTVRKINGGN